MRIYSAKGKKGTRWGVDYFDLEGRRVRRIVGDKAKAERELARVRLALEAHDDPSPSRTTIAEVRDLHLAKGNKSADRDRARWDRLIGQLAPGFLARKLKLAVWESVRGRLGPASPAGRNRYLVTYKAGLSLAVRHGLLKESPLRWVSYERVAEPRRRRIALGDEEPRLWSACRCSRDRVLLALAIYSAARRGEIHRARREHFDLEASTWWIPSAKSGKPRTVPLHPVAVRELAALFAAEPEVDRLYTSGKPEALTLRFREIRRRAGIDLDLAKGERGLGLHDLRRTAATRAIQAKVPIPTVMAVLGHDGLDALSHYLVTTAEHARAFIAAIPDQSDDEKPGG